MLKAEQQLAGGGVDVDVAEAWAVRLLRSRAGRVERVGDDKVVADRLDVVGNEVAWQAIVREGGRLRERDRVHTIS